MAADPAAPEPARYSIPWWSGILATVVSVTFIVVFVVAAVTLWINAKDVSMWSRHVKLFEGLTPLAGAAAGWIFGREVHRKAAVDYKNAAAAYRRDAQRGREFARAVQYASTAAARRTGASGDPTTEAAERDAASHLGDLARLAEQILSDSDTVPADTSGATG